MAKLNKKMQGDVDNAESASFTPMPDGRYHFRLRDVDASREGAKGPYWSWEYECVEDDHKGRRQWNNTSLSQAWSLKQTFEAFDVPTDTDTDDIVGKVVQLQLSTRTIQQGSRKGELANQVDRVLPADPDFLAAYDKQKADAKETADIF